MITWSKSTKPCPIITWDGVVFNGEHHYVDHIYYMIHARPLGLSVSRPYLHMLGSSSLTRVFCVCKTGLHPLYVNVELITPIITWCISTTNCNNDAYSGRILIPWNLVRDHWGSPGLGGARIAELSSLAGLQDYEDTRLKTSSCAGWDFPWRGRQAWRYGYVDLLPL